MPKLNVPLLEQVITFIKDNPEKHIQQSYTPQRTSCGTGMCLAGWACELSGVAVAEDAVYSDGTPRFNRTVDGRSVPDTALDLLGLSMDAAALYYTSKHSLFGANNTLDDIERIAKDLINESKLIDG